MYISPAVFVHGQRHARRKSDRLGPVDNVDLYHWCGAVGAEGGCHSGLEGPKAVLKKQTSFPPKFQCQDLPPI